jgi:hypothetical protein
MKWQKLLLGRLLKRAKRMSVNYQKSKNSKLLAALRSAKASGLALGVVAQALTPNASAAAAVRNIDQIAEATTSTMTTRPTMASTLLVDMPAL